MIDTEFHPSNPPATSPFTIAQTPPVVGYYSLAQGSYISIQNEMPSLQHMRSNFREFGIRYFGVSETGGVGTEINLKDDTTNLDKVTKDRIDALIVSEHYWVPAGSCLTVCMLKLVNGFTVTGESSCVSPSNFNLDIGKDIARGRAIEKLWMLEGYLLNYKRIQAGLPTSTDRDNDNLVINVA